MATTSIPGWSGGEVRHRSAANDTIAQTLFRVLQWAGSLKVTVVLFALSLVLVMVGTIAQQELNMVDVKDRYFTSWIAEVRFSDYVPRAFFRVGEISGWHPFPGGALIGLLLLVNLIAAKATRFHIRAAGGKLWLGIGIFALGLALCYFVISWGNATDGVQGEPKVSYNILWRGMVSGMTLLWITTAYLAWNAQRLGWRLIWGTAALSMGILGILSLTGYFSMSPSSLRITWQLLEGSVVALVMLVGSRILFGQQGGNLLLHFGVALLMIGQFSFGDVQLEQRLSLVEGESTNTMINMDKVELTFTEHLADQQDQITAIPKDRLAAALDRRETIEDPQLPVDVRVLEYYPNSDLQEVEGKNLATRGIGERVMAVERPAAGGTTSQINLASAYVELLDKQSKQSLGVYLISQQLGERSFLSLGSKTDEVDTLEIGDQKWELGMRFSRVPKPYWVQVKDVRRINYSGTQTPRDYSSFITLVDTETGEVRNERVWMNNPLRYRGETFYQSSYEMLPGGREFTSIQVVRNSGWMIPYVACMIVAVGMLAHFTGTFDRFLGRREREKSRQVAEAFRVVDPQPPALKGTAPAASTGRLRESWWVYLPALASGLLCIAATIPWNAVQIPMTPRAQAEQFDFYRAGEIPVRFGGRVLPLDSLAQQLLYAVSNRTSLPLKPKGGEVSPAPRELIDRAGKEGSLAALPWLLEVAHGDSSLSRLHMVRIDADEVLSHFQLTPRKSKLYSLQELGEGFTSFAAEATAGRKKEPRERSFKEEKFIELGERLEAFQLIQEAFAEPSLPPLPPQMAAGNFTAEEKRQAQFQALTMQIARLREGNYPAVVPPSKESMASSVDYPPWQTLTAARFDNFLSTVRGEAETPAVSSFFELIAAYQTQDAAKFNASVDEHLKNLAAAAPADYQPRKVAAERWLDATHPTNWARILYGLFLVVGLLSIAVDSPGLRKSLWWAILCVAILHSLVLITRIYITGKAPVINLYSSAIFIGWAIVIASLIYERIFPRGIGSLIAAATGLLTLMVARALGSGDTMPVLQAVLDTQFWLATHVITVTLGYAATFLAGALGIGLLTLRLWRNSRPDLQRDIYRMLYSATCFGILFSFVGTVLGGLWADDSWGRFWGWDPKENGALLIVIWNALMLHARWDGMVRERGMAMLAIGGNIVTAWSWFGTNQLGIGLHSYGGNSGAKMWLGIFILSQLVILALAWGFRGDRKKTSAAT